MSNCTQEQAKIDNNFSYHKPFGTQPKRYEAIRAKAKEFANFLNDNTPKSREQSVAFTKLEEAVFWANASIARNESEGDSTVQNAVTSSEEGSVSEPVTEQAAA